MFQALLALQGKKLTWVGFDAENEGFYLTFEDGSTFQMFGEQVDQFNEVAKAILAEDLVHAKQMLALEELLSKPVFFGAPREPGMTVDDIGQPLPPEPEQPSELALHVQETLGAP